MQGSGGDGPGEDSVGTQFQHSLTGRTEHSRHFGIGARGCTMMFFGRHSWRGETGKRYSFRCALTKNGIPGDSGGIYVFVRRRFGFFLQALYVGKAANLRGRLLGHEKWGTAWWILGATERHVMRVPTETERCMIEEDLIRGLKPRMNDVQMPRNENDAPNTPQLRKSWIWRRQVENFFRKLFGMKPRHVIPTYRNTHRHHPAAPARSAADYWGKSA
jgi:hypothetical protein